jgi:hypothetical protein
MVSQDRMMVERYTRRGEAWVLSEFSQPEQALPLDSIGCVIPLDQIYAKVKLSPKDETPAEPHPR